MHELMHYISIHTEYFVFLEVERREAIATLTPLNPPLIVYKMSDIVSGSYIMQ